ncbi:MAG: HNH endonuclease [Candidatus Tectimicrobiota bacterium]|nr:MAG: HNH endonuclease [Candidatus Tectomicrobia bacterium]
MEPVLLLNASFEPLRVINWKRALTLLFAGKVEVLEEYSREIHSVRLTLRLPAVVRLHHLIRVRHNGVKFSRQNLYARDGYQCQYCGRRPPLHELTYDHVIPRALGGPTDWTNIVTCCVVCNRRKGGKPLEESGLRLLRPPRKPAWNAQISMMLGLHNPPDSWRAYLFPTSHSAPPA